MLLIAKRLKVMLVYVVDEKVPGVAAALTARRKEEPVARLVDLLELWWRSQLPQYAFWQLGLGSYGDCYDCRAQFPKHGV